jgi:hypothetical protein
MNKIWIIRERIDWHNTEPHDATEGYVNESDARNAMNNVYVSAIKYFEEEKGDDIVDTWDCGVKGFVTSREDYYNIWVEQIEVK